MMSVFHEIGRSIVDIRKRKGITQEELALEAEMSVSYLRTIEHGNANPTIKTIVRLTTVLNKPITITFKKGEGENELEI